SDSPTPYSSTTASLHLVLTILPPPPTSTLFPYTTLFRSHLFQRREFAEPPGEHRPQAASRRDAQKGIAFSELAVLVAAAGDERPDRKSTRLNSSHVSISYAVFCLKKKNSSHTQDISRSNI